jgi:L-methionine (R)-S-oxide reductase
VDQSKSEVLDEIRLQIGRCGDISIGTQSLIEKVNQLIVYGKYIYKGSYFYSCMPDAFHLVAQAGEMKPKDNVTFGENYLTLCSLRGKRQVFRTYNGTQIYVPCYKGHHLLGVLVVISDSHHDINQDDYDFLSEVVEYVKNKLIQLGEI